MEARAERLARLPHDLSERKHKHRPAGAQSFPCPMTRDTFSCLRLYRLPLHFRLQAVHRLTASLPSDLLGQQLMLQLGPQQRFRTQPVMNFLVPAEASPGPVELSEGIAPPAGLQNRACHVCGTRLLI
jgi:hypothetical protein